MYIHKLEEIEADRRIGRCISKRQGGRDWGLYRAAAGARGRHRGAAAALAVRSGACVLLG